MLISVKRKDEIEKSDSINITICHLYFHTRRRVKEKLHKTWRQIALVLRERSDKYLASPPQGATTARDIYYRVVHSRRRLLSKFQSYQIHSFF